MALPPIRRSKPRLGELLVHMGYLQPAQVEDISAHQRRWGMSFGRAAVARGLCTDEQVVAALSRQTGMSLVDLDLEVQAPEVVGLLPVKAAQEHRAVVLGLEGGVLKVAMAAPAPLASQDAIRVLVGKSRLQVNLASDEAIDRALSRFYGLPAVARARTDPGQEVKLDTHGAVTNAQPMLTPQVAVMPGQERTQALLPLRSVAQVELLELLGLSARVSDMVQRTAAANKLTHREVIQRVLEQWARSMVK